MPTQRKTGKQSRKAAIGGRSKPFQSKQGAAKKTSSKSGGLKSSKKKTSGHGGQRIKQNNLNILSSHVIPRAIDDKEIKNLEGAGKFPKHGPVGKHSSKLDGKGMVVAILDTGVNEHQDLENKIIKKINYLGSVKPEDVKDAQGHGTHIAGIICGSQSKTNPEIKGIAPGAKIVSVKITKGERGETALWHIADGLERIIEHNNKSKTNNKVTAVVICFNAFDNAGKFVVTEHHRLAMKIKELYKDNIPVICSGGNNYDHFSPQEGLAYPAYIKHVIAVAAKYNISGDSNEGSLTEFSQRISENNKVFENYFIKARGYQTISTGMDGKSYTEMSGSSQAAAVIAGTVLLMQQKLIGKNGRLPEIDTIVREIKDFGS